MLLHFEAEDMNVAWLERLTQYSQPKFDSVSTVSETGLYLHLK